MRVRLALLFLFCVAVPLEAQQVTGRALSIGASPTTPSGSSIRITGLAGSGGDGFILTTSTGDGVKRVIVKADLPATVGYTDEAETWSLLQTFTSGLTSNGLLTIGGANDLLLGTGGLRAPSGSILLRNIADSANIATFGDAAIALNQPTTFTGLVTIGTGIRATATPFTIRNSGDSANLATFGDAAIAFSQATTVNAAATVAGTLTVTAANDTVVGTGGIRAGSGAVIIRNVADSFTTASIGDAAIALNEPTTVNDALTITGLTTAAKVKTTGVYGVANPFVIRSTTDTIDLAQFYDAGRNVVTNTGNDTVWEYHGLGNPSGSRVWRAGNIGGSYLIQSGNDAASVWTNLSRSTMASGVPNGWYWGTGVRSVNPDLDFTTDMGAYPNQYANFWVRNLWATTLVAQDVISTIGGAILVTPTTKLEAAVTNVATTFSTTHNEMVAGDIAYINDNLQTEYVQVVSGPIAGASTVTYIANAEAVGATITIPAHQIGDLIVIFAFANTATVPTLGAQFTNVTGCNTSGGTTGSRIGYMVADTASEVSGTWTNATSLMVHVYRSSSGLASAPGACAVSNASASTSLTYPALTLSKTDHSSWVARAAISSAGTNIQNAPTGYTLRANNTAVPETASFDSNGRILATSVAVSAALTVTSANWRSVTLEIVGIGLAPYSYTVTRGYGGVFAARAWAGGVALANTGTTGDGGINMYAIQSIKGSGEQGPTIQGYKRTSTTYNALSTRWALGNLRGLYNYGAVDVMGAAFGDPTNVWVTLNDVDGMKFYTGATTVNAHYDLSGGITLGQTGAGQANTYITPASVALRAGVVNRVLATNAGVEMFDASSGRRFFAESATGNTMIGQDGAGQENLLVTSTDVVFRSGGTNLLVANGTNGIAVNDTSGTTRVLVNSSGALFGITTAGNGNIFADTSGNLTLRSGTVNRMSLGASNGVFQIFDDDGTTPRVWVGTTTALFGSTTGARVELGYAGSLSIFDAVNERQFYADNNNVIMGNIYDSAFASIANRNYVHIQDTSISLCNTTTGCGFQVTSGAVTNMSLGGNLTLTTGGTIVSTGNFSLTQANGLTLEASGSSTGDAARRVYFGTVGGSIYGYSGTLQLNGGTGAAGYHGAGNVNTVVSGTTYHPGALYVGSTSGSGSTLLPNASGTAAEALGSTSYPWSHLYLAAPANSGGVNAPDQGFLVYGGGGTLLEKYTTGLDMDMTYDYGVLVCTIRIRNGIVTEFLGCV